MKKDYNEPVKYVYANGYPTPEQKEMFADRFALVFGYVRKSSESTTNVGAKKKKKALA